jgi:hypothetical protein
MFWEQKSHLLKVQSNKMQRSSLKTLELERPFDASVDHNHSERVILCFLAAAHATRVYKKTRV